MTGYHEIPNFSLKTDKLLDIVFNVFHVLQFIRSSREKATARMLCETWVKK